MVHSESVLYNLCNCLLQNGRSHKLLKVMFLEQQTRHTHAHNSERNVASFFCYFAFFLDISVRASAKSNQHGENVKGRKTKYQKKTTISHITLHTFGSKIYWYSVVAVTLTELLYTSAQRHIIYTYKNHITNSIREEESQMSECECLSVFVVSWAVVFFPHILMYKTKFTLGCPLHVHICGLRDRHPDR